MKKIKVESNYVNVMQERIVGIKSGILFLTDSLHLTEQLLFKELKRLYPKYKDRAISYSSEKKEMTIID